MFAPPTQTYHARSRFLFFWQVKKELSDYVQELRARVASMQLENLPEAVQVTIFMEGLRIGVASTDVFRVHPSTSKKAVDIALNAEFNFKSARYGTQWGTLSSVDKVKPMDLSQAEEEAELQAAKQQRNIRRCYTCGSTRHLHLSYQLRKQLQHHQSHTPA